jgi:hypothetical protein
LTAHCKVTGGFGRPPLLNGLLFAQGRQPSATLSAGRRDLRPYTGSPFAFANSFSEVCGRAPMCWITSAAASAPSRPAAS